MTVLQDMAELPPIDQHLEKEHQEKTKGEEHPVRGDGQV